MADSWDDYFDNLGDPNATPPTAQVSPELLAAQQAQESGNNSNAVSPKGALGLAQIMPATAVNPGFGVAPVSDPTDPMQAHRFQQQYMAALTQQFGGDTTKALAAYNDGIGNVNKLIASGNYPNGLPPETKKYISNITGAVAGNQLGAAAPASPPVMTSADWDAHFANLGTGGQVNGAPPSGQTVSSATQTLGPMRYIRGGLGEFVKGAETELGVPGDLESMLPGRNIPMPVEGNPSFEIPGGGAALPTSQQLLDMSGRAGITDQSDLLPGYVPGMSEKGVLAEQTGAGALRGIGAALPLAALPGLPAVSTLVQGAAGGAAGALTNALAPSLGPAGQLVAGAGAGLAAQGISGVAAGKSLENIAGSLGASKDFDDAGTVLQTQLRNWRTTEMPAQIEAQIKPVSDVIGPAAPVPLTKFTDTIKDLIKAPAEQSGVAAVLDPSTTLPSDLMQALTKSGTVVDMGNGTAVAMGTWQGANYLRKLVGESLGNPSMLRDVSEQQKNAMYGALRQDMGSTADAAGVGDEFNSAMDNISAIKQFADGPVSKIISGPSEMPSSDPNPGRAAKALLSSGTTSAADLQALRGVAPQAIDELAAAHLNVNPAQWSKLTQKARDALVPDPDTQAAISAAVAQGPSKLKAPVFGNDFTSFLSKESGLGAFGAGLAHYIPHLGISPELGAGVMAGANLVIPPVWHAGQAFVQNPLLLRSMGIGAVGAAPNALFPTKQQQQ